MMDAELTQHALQYRGADGIINSPEMMRKPIGQMTDEEYRVYILDMGVLIHEQYEHGNIKSQREEQMFIVGAMCAMRALGLGNHYPTGWVLNILGGLPVYFPELAPKREEKTVEDQLADANMHVLKAIDILEVTDTGEPWLDYKLEVAVKRYQDGLNSVGEAMQALRGETREEEDRPEVPKLKESKNSLVLPELPADLDDHEKMTVTRLRENIKTDRGVMKGKEVQDFIDLATGMMTTFLRTPVGHDASEQYRGEALAVNNAINMGWTPEQVKEELIKAHIVRSRSMERSKDRGNYLFYFGVCVGYASYIKNEDNYQ